jgi:hypothetical protein
MASLRYFSTDSREFLKKALFKLKPMPKMPFLLNQWFLTNTNKKPQL